MHTAIQIFEDNYMHIFHTPTEMIAFDCAEPKYIEMALKKKLTENYYLAEHLEKLEDCEKRNFLGFFTTHSHSDHSAGDKYLGQYYKRITMYNNERIIIGDWEITATHIPFHTDDSYLFTVIDNYRNYHVCGDILFFLGCGKNNLNDFTLMEKGLEKIRELPNGICLYGHNYNRKNYDFTVQFYRVQENILSNRFLHLKVELEENPFFNLEKTGHTLKSLRKLKDEF